MGTAIVPLDRSIISSYRPPAETTSLTVIVCPQVEAKFLGSRLPFSRKGTEYGVGNSVALDRLMINS